MIPARGRPALLAIGVLAVALAASCDDHGAVMRDGTNAGLAGISEPAERAPTLRDEDSAGGRPTANEIGDR
jgi:hypothetical protein